MALLVSRLLQHLLLPGTALLLSGLPLPLLAHPGRVNGQGCHNNRSTGNYHCHDGADYGGGGGGSSAPPAPAPRTPVCRDVAVQVVTVALTKLNAAGQPVIWKQQSGVSISTGSATLSGQAGKLYRYTVEGLEIRNFHVDAPPASRFSFAGASWIPAREVLKRDDATISILEANPLSIHSEEFRSSTESRQVCS